MRGGKALARMGVVVMAGSIVGAIANFALAAVLGNGLGPAGTGTFFAVVAAFAIASNVLELGADTGLVRTLPRYLTLGRQVDVGRTIWIAVAPVVVVGVLFGLLVWLGAEQWASLLGGPTDEAQRAEAYSALTPFVLAASLLAVFLGGTRGLGGVLPVVLIQNVGVPVARLLLVTVLLAGGASVVTVLRWWAITLPVAVVLAATVLFRMWRVSARSTQRGTPRPVPVLARDFWGFSGARGVAAAIEIVLEWVDVLAVALLLSPREAGIYAVVTRIVRVGQLVEHAARVAVSPLVSSLSASGETGRLNAVYEGVTRALVGLALPFYLTVVIFAPTLLELFGPGFAEGSTALRLASVGMGLALCAGALQSVILMAGRGSWQVRNKSAALVTCVLLLFVLVPRIGLEGAAVAWVGAIAVDTTLAALQARRLGVRLRSRETLWLVLAAIAFVGSIGAFVRLTVPGVGGLVVHGALVVAFYGGWLWWRRAHLLDVSRGDELEADHGPGADLSVREDGTPRR